MNDNWTKFVGLVFLTILLSFVSKWILDIDELLFNTLSEQLTIQQVENAMSMKRDWEWLGYLAVLLLIFIKIIIIALVLDFGLFIYNKDLKFKTLFSIVLKAEYIFLFVIIFKTVWFLIFQPDFTLEGLQYFYPFSLLNIVGYEGMQPWFIYPFQVINLFELAYWFVLAYLIGKEINSTTDKGFSIVASSYGVMLLIWVVGVMFFTLNMS